MTALDLPSYPTLEAIDAAMEAGQQARFRPYLGMSEIGRPCDRELWLKFRWAVRPSFNSATLRRFDDGHRSEDIMAARLRMVPGVRLLTVGEDGQQFGFSDFGGHFRGHMDGAILGLREAPKTWHVWEHKATNEAKFKQLGKLVQDVGEKAALAKWDAVYYAQAVLYMHYSGMTRHYLTCATPGTRDVISVRTEPDPEHAARLIAKAERIIFDDRMPEPVSGDPSYYLNKWCSTKEFCHPESYGRIWPELNARTSALATPERDGTWTHAGRVLSLDEQAQCPPDHVLHPDMVPWPLDGERSTETEACYLIDGKPVMNGAPGRGVYSSAELIANAALCAEGNECVEMLRGDGARVVG